MRGQGRFFGKIVLFRGFDFFVFRMQFTVDDILTGLVTVVGNLQRAAQKNERHLQMIVANMAGMEGNKRK